MEIWPLRNDSLRNQGFLAVIIANAFTDAVTLLGK